jgi:hypothetical protein
MTRNLVIIVALSLVLVGAVIFGWLSYSHKSHPGTNSTRPGTNSSNSAKTYPKADDKEVVDLGRFYKDGASVPSGIRPRLVIDGIPFHPNGRVSLYGKSELNYDNRSRRDNPLTPADYPDAIGIPVGRKFFELDVLHYASWPDVDGQIVARFRLNYKDGTTAELPVIYGAHVRDGSQNRNEETETLSDPDSKVIWRSSISHSTKVTHRVFKTRFANPHPEKVVKTMDIVSTHQLAGYQLLAASVADVAGHRPVTPPVPPVVPALVFDGKVLVKVVDENGHRVEGALVQPGMNTDGPGMVSAPFYSDDSGSGKIHYSKANTTRMSIQVGMEGYTPSYTNFQSVSGSGFPEEATLELIHTAAP